MRQNTEPILTVDKSAGMILLEKFGIFPVCHFCKIEITEKNFGGMFDKDKAICDALPCVMKTKEQCKKQDKNLGECYGGECSNDQFYKCFPDDAPLLVDTVLKIRNINRRVN